MLSKIIKKEDCAACRYCCIFAQNEGCRFLTFEKSVIEKLSSENIYGRTAEFKNGKIQMKFPSGSPAAEAPCPFLDSEKGCVLSSEDKPFVCKIWPLVMTERNGNFVIALSPTCPAAEGKTEEMKKLLSDSLSDVIYSYYLTHKDAVFPFENDFIILSERETDNLK